MKFILQSALAITLSSPLFAVISFTESSDGELSGDNLNPTALGILGVGTSSISGTVVDALGANPNVDVFTFNIAEDTVLSGITVANFTSMDDVAFLGFAEGTDFPFNATELGNTPDQNLILGGNLFGGVVGSNIIDTIGNGVIGTGFTAPLDAGDYTLYLQQLGVTTVDYTIELDVTSVPEPSSIALLGLGGLALLRRKR